MLCRSFTTSRYTPRLMRLGLKLLIALSLSLASTAHAYEVISIADGDTMTVLVNRSPVKIRLANIDAPEKNQPFGQRSKQSLSKLCWGKNAEFVTQSIDRYRRSVAIVFCDGTMVNKAQVAAGMAWVYPKYNKDPSLPTLEQSARLARLGLWAEGSPVPPWDWRKLRKKGQEQVFQERSL
jgi:micrococcal nuclease